MAAKPVQVYVCAWNNARANVLYTYIVSQENVSPLASYNFDIHQQILNNFQQKCYWESKQWKVFYFSISIPKTTYFNPPLYIWRPGWGWPHQNFTDIFGIRKLRDPGLLQSGVCMIRCLVILVMPTYDGPTNGRAGTRQQYIMH